MFTLILALFFLSFTVPIQAQSFSAPVLEPIKSNYALGEPFSFSYKGSPQPLKATLTNQQGEQLPFKAVLRGSTPDTRRLEIESPTASSAGIFTVKITSGLSVLADQQFTRGDVRIPFISPTPSQTQKLLPDSKTVRRMAPTVASPDRTYETTIEYIAEESGKVTIADIVPINALIDSPEASSSIKPELLNLRFPFEREYEMTSAYGVVNPVEHLGIEFHDGTDYALPQGVPIHAVDDGEVVPYREKNSYGITAAIQHTWGRTFYGHLSTTSAQLGTQVRKGDIIGLSGNTGLSSGPHIHFGMMVGDEMVDSSRYLSQFKDTMAATKQLSWDFNLEKGETAVVKYKYSLPSKYESYDTMPFGPAKVYGAGDKIVARERTAINVIISSDETEMQKIVADPSYSSTSPIVVRDGVLLWIDANDDRILHGFDKITGTSFTQAIDPEKDNELAIDHKIYMLRLTEGVMTLTQK